MWLPQMPLRVEVLGHPAWDGHPLVLGSNPGERRAVKLCSPEAARSGIRPGLPLREALTLCPDAIILEPDPVRIAAVQDTVLAQLQQVSPTVEVGEEQFFLDLRGLRGVYEGELSLLERALRTAVPPLLRPRLGIAGGKFTARIAALAAPLSGTHVVPSARTAAFLAPLPVEYLPLPADVLRRLELLGLRRIADLAALPFGAVQAEFGPPGARAWRLAHGQDDEPLIPQKPEPVVRAALRFDTPIVSTEALFAILQRLLARAFTDPLLHGRATRQARLRALLSDDRSWERLFTFKEVASSGDAAFRTLKSRLQVQHALPTVPIMELSVELMGLGAEAAKQPSLLLIRPRQPEQIAETARQLRARYGGMPLYHVVEMEPWSRIPERRWALMPYDP